MFPWLRDLPGRLDELAERWLDRGRSSDDEDVVEADAYDRLQERVEQLEGERSSLEAELRDGRALLEKARHRIEVLEQTCRRPTITFTEANARAQHEVLERRIVTLENELSRARAELQAKPKKKAKSS